ncbi:hypothetical protein ACFVZH_07925 [Streptomyces sp. NPDC059534]|uniref:hypothetical protein n=1 Tax=Streptomyces sp. NPDC059534 TaxID=3346859 RepID=UPI0036CAF03D
MAGNVLPAGPIFGPDSLVIDVDGDGSGSPPLGVPIRPDARNAELAAAHEPTRYYFQPPRVTVATRLGSSDLDFSATVTVEAPVTPHPTYLGGSCTFSCTAALPDGAEARIVDKLAHQDHPEPPARIAPLFVHRHENPAPELLMAPITGSAVSCVIEDPPTGPGPLVMSVQGGPSGGIDIQARSSFLVSFSPAAAESVVTNLRDASAPPFVIRNVLTQQFDTGAASVIADVVVAMDKLHAVLAATVPPGEPWPGGDAAITAYRSAVATGAVRTSMSETTGTGAPVGLADPSVLAWLVDTDELRKAVFLMAKNELFDVLADTAPHGAIPQAGQPTAPPAPVWWTDVFGDTHVTLKREPSTAGVNLEQILALRGTVTAEQTIEGGLAEVAAAARTQLSTYLAVIAI